MKRLLGERRKASGLHPDGPDFKERRKSYYQGKYSKRMLSLLVLVSCVALIVIRQST
jgi:hypothetical protein